VDQGIPNSKFVVLMCVKLNKVDCMNKVAELHVGYIPNYRQNLHQNGNINLERTCVCKSQFVMLSHLVMFTK
jgi:hypothetical protein